MRAIRAVTRSLTPSATRVAPKIMMTRRAAGKGFTTNRMPRTVGIREERIRGMRMGGLGVERGENQGELSHSIHQKEGAQHQGEEGENCLGPGEGKDGKRQGKDGQEEIPSGALSGFAPLDIPPEVADGVSRRAGGQGPYEDGTADAGEEEQGEPQEHIEQRDPDRGCPGPEELQSHSSFLLEFNIKWGRNGRGGRDSQLAWDFP